MTDHPAARIQLPARQDPLPLACAATCTASIDVQRMAVKAAATGDAMLLKQAMLHDPLVSAVCDPEEVWQMTDEMLLDQARFLPRYKKAMPAARKRLKTCKRVALKKWKGAARMRVRSAKEIMASSAKVRALAAEGEDVVDRVKVFFAKGRA